MDLLGTYSDSDTEDQTLFSSAARSSPPPAQKANTQKKSKGGPYKKKRKKLDISFLPENIQRALARGDTNRDSDSDDERSNGSNKIARTSNKPSPALQLLSMLPKPTNEQDVATSEKTEPLVDDKHAVEKSIMSECSAGNHVYVILEDASDTSSEDDSARYTSEKAPRIAPPPSCIPASAPTPEPSYQLPTSKPLFPLPSFSSVASTIRTAPTSAPQLPVYAPPHTAKPSSSAPVPAVCQQQQQQQQQAMPSHQQCRGGHMEGTSRAAPPAKSKAATNRRRERDIHLSLLQGNISALDNGAAIVDVQQHTEWDNAQYLEQQKRQQELQSTFNFKAGSDKQIAQPTKMQNKKHQINSLAFSAAESELDLLEARGRQMKTKSETQAKYGW